MPAPGSPGTAEHSKSFQLFLYLYRCPGITHVTYDAWASDSRSVETLLEQALNIVV